MPETETPVRTVKLTKIFRDFWLREKVTAVCDLDLDIRGREVFGLLGPNGSGKSTTLKMILGLLFPTRGRIAVFGRRPSDVAIKARIGFLPEESYLYPFLNAWETLEFYGQLFRQPRRQRRRRIEMLLEMVGLASVAYRRVGEYSKGMQRRIGLAQALINDPDLLILDEPTAGMDPIGTRQFKDLIRTLAGRDKTVLLSSHLLADVEDVCDRVCILYGGQQRAEGNVGDLLAQQNLTQITTEKLDEHTLERVRGVLGDQGGGIIEVTTPRDKLEALFLRIVQEAQSQRLATGGSVGGGEVAEFLRAGAETAPGGREVIEQLATAPPSPSGPVAEAPRAPESPGYRPPKQDVLDELVASADRTAPEDTPAPPIVKDKQSVQGVDQPQGDRKVIDDLTGPEDS